MCSEVSKIDDAPQRGLVFFLQRFQDFFIAVFAEQLVAVFVRGSRWVMRFVVLLQVQHCQFAQGGRFCSTLRATGGSSTGTACARFTCQIHCDSTFRGIHWFIAPADDGAARCAGH